MDPDAIAARLRRSRERLQTVLLAGQPGHEDADVFPRSRTMRFLLDPARRSVAAAMLGSLTSVLVGRAGNRRPRSEQRPGRLRRLLRALLDR